jgi:hypothetical protein
MLLLSGLRSESYTNAADLPALSLFLLGAVLAAAAGRVVYQMSLTATSNDNGFVSMFLLLVPAVTCLVSIPMSWWISELKIAVGPTFFLGLFTHCRAVVCVFASILALGESKTLMQRGVQLQRSAAISLTALRRQFRRGNHLFTNKDRSAELMVGSRRIGSLVDRRRMNLGDIAAGKLDERRVALI